MASSANNPPAPAPHSSAIMEDLEFFYVSNANVSNFVSVKLSGDHNYHLWKMQMLCLMESYNLLGILDATFIYSRTLSPEIEKRYQSLVKGWIFGSISEELLGTVVDLGNPKAIWDKLKSVYDPTMMSSQQETKEKHTVSTETEIEDMDMVPTETRTQDIDLVPVMTKAKGNETIPIGTKVKSEDSNAESKNKIMRNKNLREATVRGFWAAVEDILEKDKAAATEAINSDGNTLLHIAVGIGRNDFVRKTLCLIEGEQLPKLINSDGSTALHIAAVVGNTEAAELLIRKNRSLLEISDHKGETPLNKAYENMRLDTIQYLLKAVNDDGKTKKKSSPNPGVKVGVNLLVNAISAKDYDLATGLIKEFPQFAVENDNVLMALAKTFPSGLDYGETLLYPIMDDICERIVQRTKYSFKLVMRGLDF